MLTGARKNSVATNSSRHNQPPQTSHAKVMTATSFKIKLKNNYGMIVTRWMVQLGCNRL